MPCRVAQRDEVCVLGEAVDDGQDDALAIDAGQTLDEVKGDVGPHLGGDLEGLQQAYWLEGIDLVPLADGARAHPVMHQRTIMLDVELGAQTM